MLPTYTVPVNGSGKKHTSSLHRRSAMIQTYLRRLIRPKQMDFECVQWACSAACCFIAVC